MTASWYAYYLPSLLREGEPGPMLPPKSDSNILDVTSMPGIMPAMEFTEFGIWNLLAGSEQARQHVG